MNIAVRKADLNLPDPRDSAFADRLATHLAERGLLDDFAAKRARHVAGQSGERLDRVLQSLGLVADDAVFTALSELLSLPLASGRDMPLTALRPDDLRADFLRSNEILPLREDASRVVVATADPFNGQAFAALEYLFEKPVEVFLLPSREIERQVEHLYGRKSDAISDQGPNTEVQFEEADNDIRRLQDMASEAPVIKLAQTLIMRAAEMQASDIHVEPREDSVRVRYRVDGMLHTVETLPLHMRAALSSRLKIMAQLNIAERRLPQDGRARVSVRGQDFDLRVSTMPTIYGESIVLRILDRNAINLAFDALGFEGQRFDVFERMLQEPNGIILVTGPTGSGKTTTLYTALSRLNDTARKVFTVEDPIEYQLAGVNQIQVNAKIGLTFATALRSILRQDPDIIMVGEIRDLETAEMALRASLTGHLVLSTVHTNNAPSTVTRLLDMGLEDYLLASCLKGVLAQRLVRKLCPACAVPAGASPVYLSKLARRTVSDAEAKAVMRPCGCPACRGTGFSGRTTIFELLPVTAAVKDIIAHSGNERAIRDAAAEDGMISMLADGTEKALRGITTIEDVLRAAGGD